MLNSRVCYWYCYLDFTQINSRLQVLCIWYEWCLTSMFFWLWRLTIRNWISKSNTKQCRSIFWPKISVNNKFHLICHGVSHFIFVTWFYSSKITSEIFWLQVLHLLKIQMGLLHIKLAHIKNSVNNFPKIPAVRVVSLLSANVCFVL